MNDLTRNQDNDDGFSGSVTGGDKLIKGQILRWNETNGWTDRDGLRPPEVLLGLACTDALQRWKDKKSENITTKPLPDYTALNAAIPQQEWELGIDGKPRPPWQHVYVVYLIDPTSAGFYTYLNSTIGARIAWDNLRERVITMRALRGAKVVPLVRLGHRPMKTNFGMKHRPDFEIMDWRRLGAEQAIGAPEQQRIAGPKPTSAAEATLSTMKTVEVPSTAEEIADKIPW
jgi:hypothetical protein